MAEDLDLKFWTKCSERLAFSDSISSASTPSDEIQRCGPIKDWVLDQLPAPNEEACSEKSRLTKLCSMGQGQHTAAPTKSAVIEQLFDHKAYEALGLRLSECMALICQVSSTFSYLLGCAHSQEAVLIDPDPWQDQI